MTTIQIKGILKDTGQIEVDLPEGWQPGEVNIEISIDPAWSDDEIDSVTDFKRQKLGDIKPC